MGPLQSSRRYDNGDYRQRRNNGCSLFSLQTAFAVIFCGFAYLYMTRDAPLDYNENTGAPVFEKAEQTEPKVALRTEQTPREQRQPVRTQRQPVRKPQSTGTIDLDDTMGGALACMMEGRAEEPACAKLIEES